MKYLNWAAIVDDIQENLVMTQNALAEKCNVSQQSVSNWKTNTRSPGVYARNVLRGLCKEAGLKLELYKIEPRQRKRVKSQTEVETPLPDEIMAFAERLAVLPKRQREKIMDMAEFMIEKK